MSVAMRGNVAVRGNVFAGFNDAEDYFSRIALAGSSITESNKAAVRAFVAGCKADGIWTAIKACCLLAGHDSLAGTLVPLVGIAPTNSGFVNGDYSRTLGLTGDGTSYLNSNRAGNADPQNSFHYAVWLTAGSALTTSISMMGDTEASDGYPSIIACASTTGQLIARSRNVTQQTHSSANRSTTGFIGTNRSESANFDIRAGGSTQNFTLASAGQNSGSITVFARGGSFITTARMSFYSIGTALNMALLDARLTTYMAALT
jgi:hypothetical protein